MKGSHRIIIQNKRIRYDFEIRRNLTIIQGNSATGKTTLIDMIQEYDENRTASGIQLSSDKECTTLSGRRWKTDLTGIQDSIVFIDEGNEFIFTDEFASQIQHTDNYYVIATRESIPSLPYSIQEIYGIRNSGKYGTLRQTYNEFFPLYVFDAQPFNVASTFLITEDSNSGYQFFQAIADKEGIVCKSAKGKSNIFTKTVKLFSENPNYVVFVIADSAAFGSEIDKLYHLMEENHHLHLYLPESFEWLILKSGIIKDNELTKILVAPGEYIDSQNYFSWERFFTALLIEKTDKTYLSYTKRKLNPVYLNDKLLNKILAADKIQVLKRSDNP